MNGFDLPFRESRRRVCRVHVGAGALDALVSDLADDPPGVRLAVVADDRVAPLWAQPLCERLRARGLDVHLVAFPAGERNKSRETKARLEDRILEAGIGRDGALVAVGGGVTGDLAGFLASTWHRGIPVVQVPTTLLAMVDAAIGGKTGVDLPGGKNLVGTFHQPVAVYADVGVLATLDDDVYVEGFAEAVKTAAVADAKLFRWIETQVGPLLRREPDPLAHLVAACMARKGRIVRADEREGGRRAALNFGHTVGHAIEAVSGYRLLHGRAVSIGLAVEADLAEEAVGFPRAHARRLGALLAAFGLPLEVPADLDAEAIVAATRRDKKARCGRARHALPARLGSMPRPAAGSTDVTVEIDEGRLLAALARARTRDGSS